MGIAITNQNEPINVKSFEKICLTMHYDVSDVIEFIGEWGIRE